MMTEPNTVTTAADTDNTVAETIVDTGLVAAAPANDFDDEELTLPETTQSLNRMGMDTIACVGCQ